MGHFLLLTYSSQLVSQIFKNFSFSRDKTRSPLGRESVEDEDGWKILKLKTLSSFKLMEPNTLTSCVLSEP